MRTDRPDGYRYAACIDGSETSMQAVELICKIR